MKKIVNIISIFLVLFLLIFSINSNAASLNAINITADKQIVHPGETIKVNISFGTSLGSYTFDVAYDNNLLEYVSVEGGTANDNGTRIRVYFYDETGGSSPRTSMSVTFKAKQGITTSNPTDLSITAEGLANPDASVTYDDIGTPIVKNIIVEPKYVDYNISLNYTGDVIVNKEKDMKLIVSSAMGKNYEHTRIIAEATSNSGGTAKILATDNQSLEHDIIQSGFGDASGEPIGGVNVSKELNTRGLFTKAGNYSITFKLIDRDDSDAVIASENFEIIVKDEETTTPDNEETEVDNNVQNNNTIENNANNNSSNETTNTEEPSSLPKTGNTIYFALITIISILVVAYIVVSRKENR